MNKMYKLFYCLLSCMSKNKSHGLPSVIIDYWVKDQDNKIILKRQMEAKTWVGNMLKLVAGLIGQRAIADTPNYYGFLQADLTDHQGNPNTPIIIGSTQNDIIGGKGIANDSVIGIVVGTNNTPVNISQYRLLNQLTDALGFIHGEMINEYNFSGNQWSFRTRREFLNQTGNLQQVGEFGIYIKIPTRVLITRDVPPSIINVPNNAVLTVQYTITHQI